MAPTPPRELADKIAPPGTSPLAQLLGDLDQRPVHVFRFPGFFGPDAPQVALWALTDEESRQAALDAYKYCVETRKLGEAQARSLGMLDAENRAQVLYRAMRRPDTPEFPFAGSITEVRRLSPDVLDALMLEYVQYLDSRSPLRRLEADGINAHIEELLIELGKGAPAAALLSSYDTGTLRLLAGGLLHQRLSATKPSSSDSSPANGGPTSSSGPSEDGTQAAGSPSPGDDGDDVPTVNLAG